MAIGINIDDSGMGMDHSNCLSRADVRNKLGPINNLVALLEHRPDDKGLIALELKAVKRSIEYLRGNSI